MCDNLASINLALPIALSKKGENLDKIRRSIIFMKANLCLMKLKTLEIFEPKIGKLISKLDHKFKKWMNLVLDVCSNSKF